MTTSLFRLSALLLALTATTALAEETAPAAKNSYSIKNFAANRSRYAPELGRDKAFINAWGISIRPAGAGGHFWVTARDVSYEYVGDVTQSPEPKLQRMHQDELKTVSLPVGGEDKYATSTVFSDSATAFVITQPVEGAEPITAPAKFLFASDGGIISAWTERKKPDGTFDRASEALSVIDQSHLGAQFFGLSISHDYDNLYAADFGKYPAIRTFGGDFKTLHVAFDEPFDENKNGNVDPGEYAPFNVQALTTPDGAPHIFVTYAKTLPCPKKAIRNQICKAGETYPGEEDTSKPGFGRVAEFTEDGKLVAIWNDEGHLSAPWGIAYAPKDFGALSGALLVGNFGDGTIAAYDATTRKFIDVLRDERGKPLEIEGLWGILFGNGQSLGDSNALYYAAGPRDERDGVFGAIRAAK